MATVVGASAASDGQQPPQGGAPQRDATPTKELTGPADFGYEINADLTHLFAKSDVPRSIQVKFFEAGVVPTQGFAAMFADESDLRSVLKTDFDLDSGKGLKDRVQVSKVVIAWENARTRTSKMHELEGEAEVRREPKRLQQPEHKAMRELFKKNYWELPEKDIPAPRWMERRVEMIEK